LSIGVPFGGGPGCCPAKEVEQGLVVETPVYQEVEVPLVELLHQDRDELVVGRERPCT
jgi:hypothetical protein